MSEYIICLDLSLNETGFAVLDLTKRSKLIDWGAIRNSYLGTEEENVKLNRIASYMNTLRTSYTPYYLVIEEWVPNSPNAKTNIQSSFKLGGVHGVVKTVLGSDLKYVNNKTLKKVITGNGNAEKQDMIDFVNENAEKLVGKKAARSFNIVNDNEADAICLGVHELMQLGKW